MKDFKNLHSTTPIIDKPEVITHKSLNFIQKNEVNSKAKSNNHIKTENNLALNILSRKKSSKNRKSIKKGKGTVKKIVYKLIVKKNSLIKKKKHKFSNIKCSIKNGLIYYITGRPSAPKYQIKVLPVFITITVDKLILSKDETKSELIQSLSLVDIQRIDQHYLGTFCFDLILNQIRNNQLEAGQLSLCAKNEKEMNFWVVSILEFKKCSIKGGKRIDHNGKIVLDLQKINEFTKNYSLSKNYELEDLYYDADDTAYQIKKEKINKLTNTLKNIMTLSQKGNIATTQLHRQYKGRLVKASQFENKMRQKIYKMKMHLTNRIFSEKEKEAKLNHKKVKRKEIQLIKNAAKQISQFKYKELLEYKSLYEHQINIRKQQAINRSKHLMRIIREENKLTDFSQCFDPLLEEFKNMKVVEFRCKKYYGLFAAKVCMRKQSFCSMCCDHHIGIKFPNKRLQCKKKCNNVIKTKKNNKKNMLPRSRNPIKNIKLP